MIFKPKQLSREGLDPESLAVDKKNCRRFGPCGVGGKALYLNSFYIDRCYYVALSSVQRAFKRVAMSKGGFTGKGMFASIPYLVVEYDNGQRKQCNFKREEDVDLLLAHLGRLCPDIRLHSVQAEFRLAEKARREEARYLKELTPAAQSAREELERAIGKLEQRPELASRLSRAARAKRNSDQSKPAYRWVALTVVLAGVVALAYGIWNVVRGGSMGLYFALFGLAAIFFFSGSQVLPTIKNNKRTINREWEDAKEAMRDFVGEGSGFPVPYWYAHPVVLQRMVRAIREGRAQSTATALGVVKADLKALNATVQVEQEEYDEVVQIKPLFLLCGYQ